jgi:hypothetical protein
VSVERRFRRAREAIASRSRIDSGDAAADPAWSVATMAPSDAEIYDSTDVEADGPIPGPHSMLSLGSAAYRPDKTLVATFSANLETLPDATGHPDTMAWWSTQPEAWDVCRRDLQPPERVMSEYAAWLRGLPGRPVFVAYPAGFDFTFVQWYLVRFAGSSPFGFAALDAKSYAMALLGKPFAETVKRNMPRRWFDEKEHTHVAVEDAIEQGAMFCNMLAERLRSGRPGPR